MTVGRGLEVGEESSKWGDSSRMSGDDGKGDRGVLA